MSAASVEDIQLWARLPITTWEAIYRLMEDGLVGCPRCKTQYARGHRDGLEERQAHIQGDDA